MVYYIQTGIFSLLILLLVYFNLGANPDKLRYDHRLFKLLVFSTAVATILDIAMYLVDGRPGLSQLNWLVTAVYYIFNPLPCFIWSLYANLLIHQDIRRVRRLAVWLAIPTAIVTVFAVVSFFNGAMFYIDSSNVYHRGPLFMIMAIAAYLYLLYTVVIVISHRHRINTKDIRPMLFFIVPPTVGGILQIIFFGTSILWMSVSFSVLVVYTNIQNLTLATDHLTGLFNRRQLDRYLSRLKYLQAGDRRVAGMMIDLNGMKQINDRFGHKAGDEALEQTALVLRQSFRRDDFIARYGGDEFAVIFMVENYDILLKAVARVQANVQAFNDLNTRPYLLSLSIGYDLYDPAADRDVHTFTKRLDDKMYEAKQLHQQNLRMREPVQ